MNILILSSTYIVKNILVKEINMEIISMHLNKIEGTNQKTFKAKIKTAKGIVDGLLAWTENSYPGPVSGMEPIFNGLETEYKSKDWGYCVGVLNDYLFSCYQHECYNHIPGER